MKLETNKAAWNALQSDEIKAAFPGGIYKERSPDAGSYPALVLQTRVGETAEEYADNSPYLVRATYRAVIITADGDDMGLIDMVEAALKPTGLLFTGLTFGAAEGYYYTYIDFFEYSERK